MRLAVVGGSGFVGREIVRQAVQHGHQVRVVARTAVNVPGGASFISADICDGTSLEAALKNTDVVINAAGLAHQRSDNHASPYHAINANGAAAVVAASARNGSCRVVLLSSISVYGGSQSGTQLNEHHTPVPESPYARSKFNGERMAEAAAVAHHIPLTVLRLATVYGAADPGNFARLIRAIATGKFFWVGDGTNRKTVVHRSDAARGCLLAATDTTRTSALFNLVGDTHTTGHIVTTIADLVKRQPGRFHLSTSVARSMIAVLEHCGARGRAIATTIGRWLTDEAYSGEAFRQRYMFSPHWTLRDGLAEEIDWLRRGDMLS